MTSAMLLAVILLWVSPAAFACDLACEAALGCHQTGSLDEQMTQMPAMTSMGHEDGCCRGSARLSRTGVCGHPQPANLTADDDEGRWVNLSADSSPAAATGYAAPIFVARLALPFAMASRGSPPFRSASPVSLSTTLRV